jgi:ribosome biogenesis GTPase
MLVQVTAGGLEPWIVLNKIDLLDPSCPPSVIDDGANDPGTPPGPIDTSLAQEIECYRDMGYSVFRTSARSKVGTPALDAALRDRTAVLIGPSGAGKSHILNCLAPTADAQLGEISEWSGRGQHTTTYVAMYPLAGRGYLVDAPGIRRLMLWQVAPEKLPSYFPEFAATAGLCDYAGCSHLTEDGCAVRDAAEQGAISPRRYRHYCEMRKSAARSRRG